MAKQDEIARDMNRKFMKEFKTICNWKKLFIHVDKLEDESYFESYLESYVIDVELVSTVRDNIASSNVQLTWMLLLLLLLFGVGWVFSVLL